MTQPNRVITRRALLGLGAAAAVGGVLEVGRRAASEDLPEDAVRRAQKRLDELGFWCGPATGEVNDLTTCAVLAYQKAHDRMVTGVLDREVAHNLERSRPVERFSHAGHVVEVDVHRQVLRVVTDGTVQLVLHASTGSGHERPGPGRPLLDDTPLGRFRVLRSAAGEVRSPQGPLYRPHYFLHDYALHGRDGIHEARGPVTAGGVAVHPRALDLLARSEHLTRDRLVWVA